MFYKNYYFQKVKSFMNLFGQESPGSVNIKNKEVNRLRLDLIREETNELEQAMLEGNNALVLDALVDLFYVLIGTIIALGYYKIFPKAFRVVHKSNMSKMCKSEEEAKETIKYYLNRDASYNLSYRLTSNGRYIVFNNSNKKILKSVNYLDAYPELEVLVDEIK